MNIKSIAITISFLLSILLLMITSNSFTLATRPNSKPKPKPKHKSHDGFPGGEFGPGGGFGIPDFGKGWGGGYGAGYGGPRGGHSKDGIVRGSVVCKEKGPCYNKKVICPARCFTSYSRSGKGFGGGGGGGSCSIDCSNKCTATC